MTYIVILQPQAQADVDQIIGYLKERSPQGAAAWCKAWENLLADLRDRAESCGLAPESSNHEDHIHQAPFKTRRGRTYRALFVVVYDTVHIIHIRGPGQDLVPPEQLQLP
jgi:plasmid stabilization system protein ParE